LGLKATDRERQSVGAGRDQIKAVLTVGIRSSFPNRSCLSAFKPYVRVWNDGAAAIFYDASQIGVSGDLTEQAYARQQRKTRQARPFR
jgi:hypothetical protein